MMRNLEARELLESDEEVIRNDNNGNGTATITDEDESNLLENSWEEVESVLNANPVEWTTGQIVGVAVGVTAAFLVLAFLFWCCYCRRRSQRPVKYTLKRPCVVRGTGAAVDANRKLPLGARFHGAEKLRGAGLTGRGVRVAVIDSGIDRDHPGFGGKVVRKQWYRSGTPLSEDDHGTHVAGTIHFLAPDADLYDYRVFGETGAVDGDIAIAKSIRQACADGCQVINMSLRVSFPIVPAVLSAVKFAHSKDVHMVCAAGNSGDGDPLANEMFA